MGKARRRGDHGLSVSPWIRLAARPQGRLYAQGGPPEADRLQHEGRRLTYAIGCVRVHSWSGDNVNTKEAEVCNGLKSVSSNHSLKVLLDYSQGVC